jgi:catecholate siderophore receptor
VPFDNPTTFAPVLFNVFQRDWHTNVDTYSGYIQDQLEITKYFELIGGLRFDRFDVAFDGRTAGVNGGNPQNLARIDDVWSHRIGAVFKPIETASIYIATSNSFLPGAGDQFANLSTQGGVTGNNLEPEEFKNTEIGFKWEVARRLFFTGALFELDRSNQIITTADRRAGRTDTHQGRRTCAHRVRDR